MKRENEVFCNQCGKKLKSENGILKEGVFSIHYSFGFFSKKDGQVHDFDLCEDCYDKMIEAFVLPCEVEDMKEYL